MFVGNRANSEYGDLMTVREWLDNVNCGGFVDDDGYGHPSDGTMMDDTIEVYPSTRTLLIPKGATHIIWFNR